VEGQGMCYRMKFFAWEEDLLVVCCSLLATIGLQPSIAELWFQKYDPEHNYTVKKFTIC